MVDVNSVTKETDVYNGASAHTYQMDVDQNMTVNEYWLNCNSTYINHSYNNVSTDDEMTIVQYSSILFALLIFKWILSPLIVSANGLTIVVIVKYIKKVTPTHVGIAFLAIAGLFVGISLLLNLVVHLLGNSVHSEHIYNMTVWVSLVTIGLNISAMLLIAFERFIIVTSWKFHQKHLTVKRQVGLCMTFFVYFLLFATSLTLVTESKFRKGVLVTRSKHKAVAEALFIPTYILITFALVYCYLKICLFMWKQRKMLISRQNSSKESNFKKEKKTTILIAIILTVYLAGTLPSFVYTMLTANNPKSLNIELSELFGLLWYATILFDIFICAWKVPQLQEGYRKILCSFRKSRTTQVAPWPNVQPCGSSLPLKPRREFDSSGFKMNNSVAVVEPGSSKVICVIENIYPFNN